jgi:phosphohistidine phosphatase SixA
MNSKEKQTVEALVARFDEQMSGAGFNPHEHAEDIAGALCGMDAVAWRMHAVIVGHEPPGVDVIAEVIIVYRERAKLTAALEEWVDRIDPAAIFQDFAPQLRARHLELN